MGVRILVAASVLAALIMSALAGSLLRRERAALVSAAEARAEAYASACREALLPQRDVFALHFATEQAGRFPGVASAAAFDGDGRVLSHTDSSRIGEVELASAG